MAADDKIDAKGMFHTGAIHIDGRSRRQALQWPRIDGTISLHRRRRSQRKCAGPDPGVLRLRGPARISAREQQMADNRSR